ncbi:thiamine pyrophosphate-binding protein [Bacillus sp. FJAT-29814]|uniref:thiamine pyrophosphate-binding protein n=1 Tax=Bacillus sp. FJAT-29814 TaxID=1729688 RepID=UPI00082BAEAA|nr:thiamine pyrophosphate-binding protein [Bacillus sp. FJAT-29814]
MVKRWAGEIAARILKEEGVEVMFGMVGGHIQSFQDFAYREGIDVFQVHHEQAGVYAADAYARITKKPGVCFGTAGPGMLNMVSAIHMAYMARTPLVCFFGGHKIMEQHRGTLQEASAEEVCRSITKWTVRVTNPNQIGFYIRKAFRDAMAYPPGPVGIELPLDTFNWEPINDEEQIAYLPGKWREERSPRTAGDPELVQKAMVQILEAERPLIIAGEGVHWSDAGESLESFVEKTGVPFNLRRLARGAIREDHSLAIDGSARKKLIKDADLIVLMGLQVGYFENFGNWDTKAKFIQINEHYGDILPTLPTDIEIVGNIKTILEQMLNGLEKEKIPRDKVEASYNHIANLKEDLLAKKKNNLAELYETRPIHPGVLGKEVSEFLPEDTTIVLDSFTASAFLTDQIVATRSGQILDSGLSGGIGHGIGMGIGVNVARPDSPVFVMMGDGGIGIGGGDIETAVRYGLPVVYMIYNDSTLCAGIEDYCYGKDFRVLGPNAKGGFNFTQDIRYDQMFAPLGCHVEHVTEPEQIKPALKRAFESGKTAVINVIGTKHVFHPLYHTIHAKEMFWHLPADEVEEPVRKRHHEGYYKQFH